MTGEPASQGILETLEQENLFVVPLDEQRRWYRLHDLFREAVLTQVQASQPDLLPHVHQRAAQWYEEQGELREAIVHALSASDFLYAARLLERAAPSLWLSGEAQAVLTWLAALPDAVLFFHARLALDGVRHWMESMLVLVQASYVVALVLMEHVLGRLEALVQLQTKSTARSEAEEVIPILPEAEVAVVQRRLRLLRALLASRTMLLRNDAEGMRLLVEEIAGLVSQEEVNWKIIGLLPTFWLTVKLQREGALLVEQLREVKREAHFAGDHRVMVHVVAWLADAYLVAGRWHLVEQECLEGLALAERIGFSTALSGYLQGFLADAYYAWNRLEEAAACVQQMLSFAQTWQHATMLMEGILLWLRSNWREASWTPRTGRCSRRKH